MSNVISLRQPLVSAEAEHLATSGRTLLSLSGDLRIGGGAQACQLDAPRLCSPILPSSGIGALGGIR